MTWFGIPAYLFTPAIIGAAALALAFLLFCIQRVKKAQKLLKERLNEAPKYTYKDFMRDFQDGKVPMSELVDRCKAASISDEDLPPELKPPAFQVPTQTVPGDKLLKARLEWFEKASNGMAKPISKAPPPPQVVVPGFTIQCGWCVHERMQLGRGSMSNYSGWLGSHIQKRVVHCNYCKGTGLVTIIGGK